MSKRGWKWAALTLSCGAFLPVSGCALSILEWLASAVASQVLRGIVQGITGGTTG